MTYDEDEIQRILSAAETIEESLGILVQHQTLDRAEYDKRRDIQDIVERRFVKLTEASLDIARTIVIAERGSIPESNPGTMLALENEAVLSTETAAAMAQAARFRNVLAHTYGNAIDDNAVYDALQDLDRYRQFLREVRGFLEANREFPDR